MGEKQNQPFQLSFNLRRFGEAACRRNSARLYLDLLKKCLTGFLYIESSYIEIRPRRGMPLVRKIFAKVLAKRGYKIFKVKGLRP